MFSIFCSFLPIILVLFSIPVCTKIFAKFLTLYFDFLHDILYDEKGGK